MWRFLFVRTDRDGAELDMFATNVAAAETTADGGDGGTAAGVALLDVDQLQRAANVLKLKLSGTVLFYARRLFPRLAAVHDELHSFEGEGGGTEGDGGEGEEGGGTRSRQAGEAATREA